MTNLAALQHESEELARAVAWFRLKAGRERRYWQCVEAELGRLGRANRTLKDELRSARAALARPSGAGDSRSL